MDSVVTISVDGLPVRLREPHDFAFLAHYGRVFRVFDEQDSGNICFGVDSGEERLFVKYAGARTIGHAGEPDDAVRRLAQAARAYHDLKHPALVEFREANVTDHGCGMVFTWFDGANYRSHPDRHRSLPLQKRLASLDTIFAFHEHVSRMGYAAIDFYDGSILYDFDRDVTIVCDIDFYRRRPCTNDMGRMWGSKRFMSPEEFELGAPIDEVTNVFNMGATAFVLLGGGKDRSREAWDAGDELYSVACRAADPDRSKRCRSIDEFRRAWDAAK